jgi:hypothetical protein
MEGILIVPFSTTIRRWEVKEPVDAIREEMGRVGPICKTESPLNYDGGK